MIGTVKELIPKMLNLDSEKVYELKEHRKKRSLDANAYYWKLINEISDIVGEKPSMVHIRMLRDYGVVYSVLLPREENIEGLIKYYDIESCIEKNGHKFISYKAYLPSSEMNTKQMAKLIDGVVSEAKELGIETLTPRQIEEIKLRWI
jgi:hypothetical protein